MASEPRGGLSSVFDDMLSRNRQQFDQLAGGHTVAPRSPPSTAGRLAPAVVPSPNQRESSATARLLDTKYRSWRHTITDRHRDGDEVVVLCKLVVDDLGVQKMQFGRASIDGSASGGARVAGQSGGVAFSLGDRVAGRPSANGEDAAYQAAIEDALARCARLL